MSATTLRFALLSAAALSLAACGNFGKVEQGRVIAYDKKTGEVVMIRDSSGGQAPKPVYDALPPLSVRIPVDPDEMGPAPTAGKLMRVDLANHELVIYDATAHRFRTIPYTPVEERHNVGKGAGLPAVDKVRKTITIYCPAERAAVTFAAPDDLLAMPADTWKTGDEVRYYFKDPAQALRMMNVTKTDLSKS
jgi:hypothetical protein